jgi:hypothetical protein
VRVTAIAWDGHTLACDSLLTDGSDQFHTVKIFRLKDGRLFGGAGHAGYIGRVLEWLGNGSKPKDRPDCAKFDSAEFSGLLIDDRCCFMLDTYLAPIPVVGKCAAVGSGASHVMTLMTAGYKAPDAIRFVILHGLADGVGGEVQTLSLSGRKPRKSS